MVNAHLDMRYGKPGTPEREKFDEESLAWFYGNMLRERRKELNSLCPDSGKRQFDSRKVKE